MRHTIPKILNLRKNIEIRLGEGDSLNDICISVADHVEPYSTKQGFERIVQEIRALPEEKAIQRILKNLRTLVEAGELPVFYDEGGLLDSNGYIQDPIRQITKALAPNDVAYIFFVSARRPQHSVDVSIPVVNIEPLRENETKRLIAMLAEQIGIKVSSNEIGEIAEYVAGYPPAAYFAIHQAKDYGIDLVLKDKTRLVQFRTSVFLRHLAKIGIDASEQDLLRLLAVYSPLPLPVLQAILSINLPTLDGKLIRFIDYALIITTQDGYYRIADPVADAVISAFGLPSEEEHKKLGRALTQFLGDPLDEAPKLELSRVLFRVARFANDDEVASTAVHLANDLIKFTEILYHARKYDRAIDAGYAAVSQRPESYNARSFLIRALIQEERWQETEMEIRELQKRAPVRDVYFLKGFLERKRRSIPAAIDCFEQAQRLGRRDAAISRELALCYFLEGKMDEASRNITEALERHGDNPYLIDLSIKIAERMRDEVAVLDGLRRFEVVAKPVYYNYRLSRYKLTFGRLPEARAAAQAAVDCEHSPPFEVLAQLAICEISLGNNLQEAAKLLTRLDKEFKNTRRDIRLGLRCRLEIARKRYGEALSQSEHIEDKSTLFYKKIRRDALAGDLAASALRDDMRAAYESELSNLEKDLTGFTAEQLLPDELPASLGSG